MNRFQISVGVQASHGFQAGNEIFLAGGRTNSSPDA